LNHLASSPACEGSLEDATVGEANPDQAVAVLPLSASRLSFPHRLRRLLVSSEAFLAEFYFYFDFQSGLRIRSMISKVWWHSATLFDIYYF
jgi:hypothetical protein